MIDPDALHAAALIDVLFTDSLGSSLDRAINALHAASTLTSDPAPVLVDLSAAYLLRAEHRQNHRDLFEAVEAAAKALQRDSANLDARFNLALGLDRIGLHSRAHREWARYRDAGGSWEPLPQFNDVESVARSMPSFAADDAELTRYAAADPQEARVVGWDEILCHWATAELNRDRARADSALSLADRLGHMLAERGGDASLSQAVREIVALRNDPARTATLARGIVSYSTGRLSYQHADYEAADRAFAAAVSQSLSSPALHEWAVVYRATTLAYRRETSMALRLLTRQVGRVDTVRFPALAARARWSLGTILLRGGNHDDGVYSLRLAQSLFQRVGERENAGGVAFVLADEAFAIGDEAAGYRYAMQALHALRDSNASVWLHNTLSTCAQAIARDGLTSVAAIMQDEGVAVADGMPQPIYAIESRAYRAMLRAHLGDGNSALGDVADAAARLDAVPSLAAQRFLEADLQLARAAILARTQPRHALSVVDSAVRFFVATSNPTRILPALVARADAWLAAGVVDSAVGDLRSATEVLDRRSAKIRSTGTRADFLDAARDVSDRLVMMLARAGQDRDALMMLERVRVWGDGSERGSAANTSRRDPPWRIPRGTRVAEYARIGDTVLVWTQVDTTLSLTRSIVSSERLAQTIEAAQTALQSRSEAGVATAPLGQLYDWLIRPIESQLGPANTIVRVVADGDIARVPFAALFDRQRREFLAERYAFEYASHLPVGGRQPRRHQSGDKLVLIADPAFEPRRFPGLQRLPNAMEETRELARLAPNAAMLSGPEATYAAVTENMPGATLVHFAGHAVFDAAQPARSYLVVAPSEGRPDRIEAREIAATDMSTTQLVVLSACATLRAYGGRSGSFSGLAGAFLQAGAGGVIASDWLVDDDAARELMVEFYRGYSVGWSPANALRAAQLHLLRASRSPHALSVWAAFRYVSI